MNANGLAFIHAENIKEQSCRFTSFIWNSHIFFKKCFGMKKLIVTGMVLLYPMILFCQEKFNAKEAYTDAGQYILSDEYSEAYPLLKQLSDKGYNNANIQYLSGICLLHMRGKKSLAIPFLESAVQNIHADYRGDRPEEDGAPPSALFYLGVAYRINSQTGRAEEVFRKLLSELDPDSATRLLIERELVYCRNARELISQAVPVKITNPMEKINTSADEFNPSVDPSEKEMVYMQSRKFYDAALETVDDIAGWSLPDEITTEIGSDGEYSVVSRSSDGNTLVLYTYDMYRGGELYTSGFSGERWLKRERMPAPINSPYSETSGSFSPDGQLFYFSSNRPGGLGGYDLYRCARGSDGKWGPAENLGRDINTAQDETTPMLSPDGKYLWFGSKGHFSMGGYDIFRSEILPDGFGYPLNAGSPVNTADDEFGFDPVLTDKTGYLAIPSAQSGNRDIMRIEIDRFPDVHRFYIHGSVVADDGSPVKKINAQLDFSGPTGKINFQPDSSGLHYTVTEKSGTMNFAIAADGYKTIARAITLAQNERKSDFPIDFILEKIIHVSASDSIRIDSSAPLPDRAVRIGNIYFSFESSSLNNAAKSQIDSLVWLMKSNGRITITLTGYTDAQGSAAYNLILSKQRAESVARLMTEKGILPDRIQTFGDGENNPLTKNLNPETRKWNRRVEIQIIHAEGLRIIPIPLPIPEGYLEK